MVYVHSVPGRLRVKLPHLKGNRRTGSALCECFGALGGVVEAVFNPLTGSVIVHYDRQRISVTEIWQMLHDQHAVEAPTPPLAVHAGGAAEQNPADGAEDLLKSLVGIVVERAAAGCARALIAALV